MTHRIILLALMSVFLVSEEVCLAENEALIFVAQDDYAPFQYYDEQGAASGLDVEVIRKAADIVGMKASFVLVPWVRALTMVETGQADGVFGCGKKTEREEFLYFPETPLRYSEMVFFANDHFQGEINRLDDVGDRKVGCVVDYLVNKEFNESTSIDKDFANSTESLFLKLAANRYPLAIYNRIAGWHIVKKLELRNIRVLPYVIASYPAYLAFSKASARGRTAFEKFSQALKQLHDEGALEKTYREYLR